MTRLNLVGPGEVRQLLGIEDHNAAVVSRMQTDGTLPEPDCRLLMGPVWLRSTIVAWANQTGREIHYE